MAPFDSLVVFAVSALIGGLGIYVGGQFIAGRGDYSHAVVTALLGALVWTVVGVLFGGLPLLGPILTLLAYLAVVKWRYRTGWLAAGGIALVAWIAALVVLYVLALVGVTGFDAVGVPGT
ncbi:MAG: hypothetical protein ABEJ23_00835 [Haloarculaceae archaeon]